MEKIINIGIIGQGGCGKTSLLEAILYNCNVTDRIGRIEDGNTIGDNDFEEIQRKFTINSKIFNFSKNNCKFNLCDTPGYVDFIGEVKSALKVMDSCIVVVDAQAGIGQIEKIWQIATEYNIPKMIFINKLDKEGAQFYELLGLIEKDLNCVPIPIQIPIDIGSNFKGIIDLIKMKGFMFENGKEIEIPSDMKTKTQDFQKKLIEAIAETDDILLEKYLSGEDLSLEEIILGLRKGFRENKFILVLCGSAYENKGINLLLDTIVNFCPSPNDIVEIKGIITQEIIVNLNENNDLLAFVFKSVTEQHIGELSFIRVYRGKIKIGDMIYNSNSGQKERVGQILVFQGKKRMEVEELNKGEIGALVKFKNGKVNNTFSTENNPITLPKIDFPQPMISFSVIPNTRKDEEKISVVLNRLSDDDPTFQYFRDTETNELIISGIGDLHLEVIISRFKQRFGVDVTVGKPKIAYKETILGTAKVQGKYKKQSGGRGQYGDVWLELQPLEQSKGFEFEDKIFGGAIPAKYVPSVEKGVRESIKAGVLANYPVIDIKVILYDGSFHPVDSSDIAFKIAASMAFRKGMEQAKPVLLEPIMNVEVGVPEEYMGDITSNLSSRRGKVLGMEARGNLRFVIANVPLAEMYKYATDLRSKTQGKGIFSMKFSHYEQVPSKISEIIIASSKKEKEEEE